MIKIGLRADDRVWWVPCAKNSDKYCGRSTFLVTVDGECFFSLVARRVHSLGIALSTVYMSVGLIGKRPA